LNTEICSENKKDYKELTLHLNANKYINENKKIEKLSKTVPYILKSVF